MPSRYLASAGKPVDIMIIIIGNPGVGGGGGQGKGWACSGIASLLSTLIIFLGGA